MSDTAQLALGLPMPLPPLELQPTPAMLAGTQVAHQCAWCGTVVIVPSGPHGTTGPSLEGKPCPACASTAGWWRQTITADSGVAGFRWAPPEATP